MGIETHTYNLCISASTSSFEAPTSARQGHALALPPAQGSFGSQPGQLPKPVSIEPPAKACSSCSLPTTTTRAPPPAPSYPGQPNIAQGGATGLSYNPQGGQQNYPFGQQNIAEQGFIAPGGAPQPGSIAQNYPGSPSYVQGPGSLNAPNYYAPGDGSVATVPHSGNYGPNNFEQAGLSGPNSQPSGESFYPQGGAGERTPKQYNNPEQQFYPNLGLQGPDSVQEFQQNYPSDHQNVGEQGLFAPGDAPYSAPQPETTAQNYPGSPSYVQGPGSVPNSQPSGQSSYPQGGTGERTAKQYKPTLISAQMQIVDKNTDIYGLGPNEQQGLPPGLTQGDMTQLLYTFNYTLGFHGHFEEGYTNGVKQGYYFVTGRNGVRTRIDYVADDTGFHPKISRDILDLLSEDVPKPETEKDERYGLKGYEFKWLYYPLESKKR